MEPTYGEDPYASRSCWSGKAYEIVVGVDDDYDTWKRLKTVFSDSEKLADAILPEIRKLKPLKDNDPFGLINLVTVVKQTISI